MLTFLGRSMFAHLKRRWTFFPEQLAEFVIIKAAAAAQTTANSFLFNKLEEAIATPLAFSHSMKILQQINSEQPLGLRRRLDAASAGDVAPSPYLELGFKNRPLTDET